MRKTTITQDTMMKAYKLHSKAVDAKTIAETLGISMQSVKRIICIMETAAKHGDVDAVCDGYKKQKKCAKQIFGIQEPKKENPPEEQEEMQSCDNGDLKELAVRVLFALDYQNKLLEKLLNELGVETKGAKK